VQPVTREELIAALSELLKLRAPTLVRTMDPDPDHVPSTGATIQSSDHPDHTAAAEFAIAAVGRYVADTGRSPALEHFRGYANARWPKNLPGTDYHRKANALLAYGGGGRPDCYVRMCGDLELGEDAQIQYGFSTWSRYVRRVDWLQKQTDGSLTAIGALGGGVVVWRGAPGGDARWVAPAKVGAQGYVAPSVTVVRGPDGLLTLLALRRTAALSSTPVVEVVWSTQRAGSLAFTDWQSLGTPSGDDQVRARETGIPVGAFDGKGVLNVFVRDFDEGLSVIQRSATGVWGSWRTAAAAGPYQDGFAVLARRSGEVEVYAPRASGVARIRQSAAGSSHFTVEQVVNATSPASPLTAVESDGGRAVLVYRPARSADIAVCTESAGATGWSVATVSGPGGIGPIGVTPWRSGGGTGTLLQACSDDGTLVTAVGAQPEALGSGGLSSWRTCDGIPLVGGASAVQAADGKVVLACLGNDGRLWTASQTTDQLAQGFADWAPVA
jgi:hypothetical protein